MRPDQLEQPRVDGGPDRAPAVGCGGRTTRLLVQLELLSESGHVLDRDDHFQLEPLPLAGVDDLHLAIRPDSAEEGGDRLQRSLGRRQADALRRLVRECGKPFQAERQMGATLGARDGVHLVDDHVLDAAQRLPRLAGQHQIEALRRGDQDVRRVLDQLAPGIGRRVAGSRPDADLGQLLARPLRGAPDAGQR